jgi:hypothetical protein
MLAHERTEESRFAAPVQANQPDYVTTVHHRRETLDQRPILDGKSHIPRDGHLIASTLGKIESESE